MAGELLRINTSHYDVMKFPPTLAIQMVNGTYPFPPLFLALRLSPSIALIRVFWDVTDNSETAWCYLHGIGTKKNVKLAARYYRMAEKAGVKSVGLSWIWKEKYDEKEKKPDQDAIRGRRSLPAGNGVAGADEMGKKGKKLFGRKNSA
jgi:hypothetical protein